MLGTFITETDDGNQFSFMIPADYYDSLDEAKTKFGDSMSIEFISILVGQRDEIIGLTGEDLERAYPGQHQQTNKPIINVEFNDQGTRKFAELTTEIAATSDKIAIFFLFVSGIIWGAILGTIISTIATSAAASISPSAMRFRK